MFITCLLQKWNFAFTLRKTGLAKTGAAGPIPAVLFIPNVHSILMVAILKKRMRKWQIVANCYATVLLDNQMMYDSLLRRE